MPKIRELYTECFSLFQHNLKISHHRHILKALSNKITIQIKFVRMSIIFTVPKFVKLVRATVHDLYYL
jgi:hypothetical protein